LRERLVYYILIQACSWAVRSGGGERSGGNHGGVRGCSGHRTTSGRPPPWCHSGGILLVPGTGRRLMSDPRALPWAMLSEPFGLCWATSPRRPGCHFERRPAQPAAAKNLDARPETDLIGDTLFGELVAVRTACGVAPGFGPSPGARPPGVIQEESCWCLALGAV
jgi:hypothetical protein